MMAMDNVNRRRNLGFFFDHAIARVPDKVAIIDLFGGRERSSTYRHLDARMDAPFRGRPTLDAGGHRRPPVVCEGNSLTDRAGSCCRF